MFVSAGGLDTKQKSKLLFVLHIRVACFIWTPCLPASHPSRPLAPVSRDPLSSNHLLSSSSSSSSSSNSTVSAVCWQAVIVVNLWLVVGYQVRHERQGMIVKPKKGHDDITAHHMVSSGCLAISLVTISCHATFPCSPYDYLLLANIVIIIFPPLLTNRPSALQCKRCASVSTSSPSPLRPSAPSSLFREGLWDSTGRDTGKRIRPYLDE